MNVYELTDAEFAAIAKERIRIKKAQKLAHRVEVYNKLDAYCLKTVGVKLHTLSSQIYQHLYEQKKRELNPKT